MTNRRRIVASSLLVAAALLVSGCENPERTIGVDLRQAPVREYILVDRGAEVARLSLQELHALEDTALIHLFRRTPAGEERNVLVDIMHPESGQHIYSMTDSIGMSLVSLIYAARRAATILDHKAGRW